MESKYTHSPPVTAQPSSKYSVHEGGQLHFFTDVSSHNASGWYAQ